MDEIDYLLFHVLVGAQRDRLFFSFPLLPRPPPLSPFPTPVAFFLSCLLASFSSRVFSFLSLLLSPLLATKIPAVGLFVTTRSVYRLLLFAIVGCVSVVADGGSGGKKEAK